MLDTLTPSCTSQDVCFTALVALHSIGADSAAVLARLITKVAARLADHHDPITRFNGPHTAGCALLDTPTDELTDQTCACPQGGDQ